MDYIRVNKKIKLIKKKILCKNFQLCSINIKNINRI